MLQSLVRLSLRHRGVVLTLACLLVGYGTWVALHAKLDVFPDFVPPQVVVQTEAPGLSPEQVETLVTRPLESALNGLGSQESLRSETIQGLSVITMVFKEGVDIHRARQLLAEKLAEVATSLPMGVRSPKMSPLYSSTMDVYKLGLLSTRLSPMELRSFADWTLKPRLLSVTGVAGVTVFGGEVRQVQIQVHPDQLVARGLTLTEVLAAARDATGVRGGGYIETANQRVVLQSDGQALTPDDIGNVLVVTGAAGAPVRIRDVATVVEAAEPKVGDALVMAKPGVLLTLKSQFGANTMEVTQLLDEALAEMAPLFEREGITLVDRLHRPATFIEHSLEHIRGSLLLGAGLVALVLVVFLGNVRTALISLAAIPLSLLSAIIVMTQAGVSLNTITLGGLAIALGEVVDDAIIDVENIVRRLRENATLPAPRPAFSVILSASLEVRSAVVYATFIVALVFVPVLTLSGLQGSFFAPLAKTYIAAILASLVTALTVTPALTLVFLSDRFQETPAPRIQSWLRARYERVLGAIARRPAPVVVTAVLLVGFALSRLWSLGGTLLPDFREGHYVLGVWAQPGTSLPEMARIGQTISERLLKDPRIATVEQQIGRAELGEDTWGPHRSEFHVELKPLSGEEEAAVAEGIRAVLKAVPGIRFEVMTFLADRVNESISGETSPVVINVHGESLDDLDQVAADIAKVLEGVPGAAEVEMKAPPGSPRIAIRLRQAQLTALGFRPLEVLEAIDAAYQGVVVAQIHRDNEVNAVAVTLDGASRTNPEGIGSLLLSAPNGQRVALSQLADIFHTEGRDSILHSGARRRQTITCHPKRDVQSFVADARRILAEKVPLPKGVYLEFSGASEAQAAATRELLLHSALAFVGIVMLLRIVLGGWRNVALVLCNLPFALAGGVLVVYAAKLAGSAEVGALTMGSLVGFVTLFGITTRNAIMLLSHCEHLVTVDGLPWTLATATRAASERLVPILMTATVTALGLLPLAIRSGEAGCEIEGPMAFVILGGLATATVLNLLILPALALRFARFTPARSQD
jgi:CzcA family heavy metal efflux pump